MRRERLVVSLILALSLLGAVSTASAQVVANPNQITGELRLTNSNPNILSLLNDTSKLGLATLSIGAESVGLATPISSTYYNPSVVGTLSTGYQITVES